MHNAGGSPATIPPNPAHVAIGPGTPPEGIVTTGGGNMSTRALLHGRMVGLGIVLLTIAFQGSPSAQQGADPSLRVGGSHLGGVVTSANGPEAGVWVIA